MNATRLPGIGLLATVAVLTAAPACAADSVEMLDGRTIRGKVLSSDARYVTIAMRSRYESVQMRLKMERIHAINSNGKRRVVNEKQSARPRATTAASAESSRPGSTKVAPVEKGEVLSLRGPSSSGCMPEWPRGVRDPKQARQLWKSAEPGLGVAWAERSGGGNKNRGCVRGAGYGGAIEAGGRVYLIYWKPSGEVVDDATRDNKGRGKDKRPESWKVEADDICVSRDAKTGRVLWRKVFERGGLNWNYGRKSPWTHVVVVGERVHWMGCAGRVYCLNARDGATVWESNLGPAFREFQSIRRQLLAARTTLVRNMKTRIGWNNNTSSTMTTPCVADGVLVCNDSLPDSGHDNGNGLAGLDADTGKFLWRLPKAAGSYVSPVPWSAGGKTYCLSVTRTRAVCLAPKTGKVVWSKEGTFSGVTPIAVGEDYLVAQGHYLRGEWKRQSRKGLTPKSRGLTAYRLSPRGAELAWALDVEKYAGPWTGPLICKGHAYARSVGGLVCVELKTGKVVAEVAGRFDPYQPLQAANGMLLAGYTFLKLDPADFRVLGGVKVWQEPFTQMHWTDGRLYVRGRMADPKALAEKGETPEAGGVYCVDLRR